MKNFFKKHDLLKIVGIAFILALLLTWFIPSGSFSGTEYVEGAMNRTNLSQAFMSGIYSINFFVLQFTFLLVLGAFYGLLSKTKGYRALVSRIANKIKGHETLFVLIASALFAILASLSMDIWHLVLFAPFVISIILKAKMNKITALSATFASILLGILGATYSGFGLGYINGYLGTTYETYLFIKFVILAVGFVLFSFFNVISINKALKEKNSESQDDPFEVEDDKKANIWPIAILLILLSLVTIVGYFDWYGIFEIEFFTNLHNSIIDFTIGDHAIFKYLLGDYRLQNAIAIAPVGNWDLFMVQVLMMLTMIITKFIGSIKLDDAIEAIGEGIKKMLKPVLIIFLIDCVFMFIYWSNFVPTIISSIIGLSENFNIFLMTISGLIASVFHVDFAFTGYLFGSWLSSSFSDSKDIIMLILNSTNGIIQLVAPTSLVLMAGLAYLDIKYKDWFKYIWKFLVGMLFVLILLFVILTYL